jgi:hypothetical protein
MIDTRNPKLLTNKEFNEFALPELMRVFNPSLDPYEDPFAPTMIKRQILYRCSAAINDDALPIDHLVYAANSIGDSGCFVAGIDDLVEAQKGREIRCAYVPLTELVEGYGYNGSEEDNLMSFRIGFPLHGDAKAMWSSSGSWGIMTTWDHFGLLGGSLEFMKNLEERYPPLIHQVSQMLKDDFCVYPPGHPFYKTPEELATKSDDSWVVRLIEHMYGKEEATEMLKSTIFGV